MVANWSLSKWRGVNVLAKRRSNIVCLDMRLVGGIKQNKGNESKDNKITSAQVYFQSGRDDVKRNGQKGSYSTAKSYFFI